MLTILHPEIISLVRSFPGGLLPVRRLDTGQLFLIIKAQKETILAARTMGGFSFYLAPLNSPNGLTVGLVTAFFDDHDEPLTIMTPILKDPDTQEILEILASDEVDVYFFDEHDREFMGFTATIHDDSSILANGTEFGFLTYSPKVADWMSNMLPAWFGLRTKEDDQNAIRVLFAQELFPSDMFIGDYRPENHDFLGSGGHSHTSLERETNPGYFQERDIVAGLKRAFRGEQLALNPDHRSTLLEFVDILGMQDEHLLLVQAKDSPNTETSLGRTIERKRHTSHHQISKAMSQAKGAAKAVRNNDVLELVADGEQFEVDTRGKAIVSLIVIQELFLDERAAFLARYMEMADLVDYFILLDYSAFNQFCYEFPNDVKFIEALKAYSAEIMARGVWIEPQSYVMEHRTKRLGLTMPPS